MHWDDLSPAWQAAIRKSSKVEPDRAVTAQDLERVEVLQLLGKEFKDLQPVAMLPRLRLLVVTSTQISDLSPLAGVKTLEKLWFRLSKKVTDLSPLEGMTWLRELQLHDTGVKARTIKEFARRHPDCLVDTGR